MKAEVIISGHIEKDIWKKYLFIAAQAGITTLFQRPLYPILATEAGRHTTQTLIGEICAVLRKEGVPADPDLEEESFRTMTSMSYHMKSSMLRDMENGTKRQKATTCMDFCLKKLNVYLSLHQY
nr:ketopantoate reductase C-terminal domain-containing protein [Bacillus subtilis]